MIAIASAMLTEGQNGREKRHPAAQKKIASSSKSFQETRSCNSVNKDKMRWHMLSSIPISILVTRTKCLTFTLKKLKRGFYIPFRMDIHEKSIIPNKCVCYYYFYFKYNKLGESLNLLLQTKCYQSLFSYSHIPMPTFVKYKNMFIQKVENFE